MKTSRSTNCKSPWPSKSVSINLQSVLQYYTAVSYPQVMIQTLKSHMSFALIKFLPHQWQIYRSNSYLVSIHLIETEQNYVTWRATAAYNHQTDLVGQSVEGQLTRLWPSKIRHSKHPDTAINQPLKRTNHKCWWVTNSSSYTNTAV